MKKVKITYSCLLARFNPKICQDKFNTGKLFCDRLCESWYRVARRVTS